MGSGKQGPLGIGVGRIGFRKIGLRRGQHGAARLKHVNLLGGEGSIDKVDHAIHGAGRQLFSQLDLFQLVGDLFVGFLRVVQACKHILQFSHSHFLGSGRQQRWSHCYE